MDPARRLTIEDYTEMKRSNKMQMITLENLLEGKDPWAEFLAQERAKTTKQDKV